MEEAVRARLLCIGALGTIKLEAFKEACHYVRDSEKLFEESIEFLKTCNDVSLNISMVQALIAIAKN